MWILLNEDRLVDLTKVSQFFRDAINDSRGNISYQLRFLADSDMSWYSLNYSTEEERDKQFNRLKTLLVDKILI